MLIEDALQRDVDYAQLAKIYGEDAQERAKRRYSPAECLGTKREARIGRPDLDHISTSFVEKHNQTMRQSMRRYACLPVGHSKKLETHRYATALHFMHYNFARICQNIRCTPAMEAGISEHVWSIEELVRLST